MKKVLTIMLVALLVIGALPLGVFAAATPSPVIGFSGPDGTGDILDNNKVKDFGQLILGTTKTVLEVPVKIEDFKTDTGLPAQFDDITKDVMDRMSIEFSNEKLRAVFATNIEKHHNTPVEDPHFIFTGMNIGKVDGQFWVVYKHKGLDGSVVRYESMKYDIMGEFLDPTINKHITAIRDDYLTEGTNFATNAKYVSYNDSTVWKYGVNTPEELTSWLQDLVVYPGDEIAFSLHTDHFVWDPDISHMRSSVRKSTLDNDFVNAIKTVIEGDGTIAKVNFENKKSHSVALVVKFREDYPITKDRDFVFNIALGMRGVRNENSAVDLMGTFGNPIYEVYEDNDYVFTGDGMVAEAMKSVRNIELDLDNGVSVFSNLVEGKRYYGKSSVLPTDDDKDIMNYFISVRKAITLKTTNIEQAARFVQLKDDVNYYVYDADGIYLGRSTANLPYRTKYYLSLEEIDFNPDEMVEPETNEEYTDDDNPSTGSGMYRFTSVLSLVGLGILGAGTLFVGRRKEESNNNEGER